jgi:hypothetical protein
MELQLRASRTFTPSNPSPWFGQWEHDGLYTVQQLRALKALDIDPATVERLDVKIKVTSRQMWWPTGPTPHRLIPCPVIGRRDPRIKVISPIGDAKLVWPSGWTREK